MNQERASGFAEERAVKGPNTWRGELDCVIGPFGSRDHAQGYVAERVDFRAGNVLERIFPRGGAWFVELSQLSL